MFSNSVFCVDFEFTRKYNFFFQISPVGAMMSTFGAHGLSWTITFKFYQKMQNMIKINIQEKIDHISWQFGRNPGTTAIPWWPYKMSRFVFEQIWELTQTIQIIYKIEALGISFLENLVLRSFEVIRDPKIRKKVKL